MDTLNVNPVSDPGCPQLSMVAPQQDRFLGGVEPLCLQEQLEAAGLRPVQVIIEGELKEKVSQAVRGLWQLDNQEGQRCVTYCLTVSHPSYRTVVGDGGLKLRAEEDSSGARLGHRDEEEACERGQMWVRLIGK